MWIVATDVRSGQRVAFPVYSSAVSFDIESYRDRLSKMLRLESIKSKIETDGAVAQVKSNIFSNDELEYDELIEQLEHADVHERGRIEEALEYRSDLHRTHLKRIATVEAMVVFDGREWPIRDIRLITSFSDIEPATARTPKVDITNLPPLDTTSDGGVEGISHDGKSESEGNDPEPGGGV